MNPRFVSRVVFVSALYDLLVTLPFATPWTAQLVTRLLASVHTSLALPGVAPSLDDPTALLFATLMGSIVTVWSVLRLLSPTPQLGAADTAGRVLFSMWMAFALAHGASPVMLPLLVAEVAWGLGQGAVVLPVVWRTRRVQA
jgi:hypothetical protein